MVIEDNNTKIQFKLETNATISVSCLGDKLEIIYKYEDKSKNKHYYIHESQNKGIYMNKQK